MKFSLSSAFTQRSLKSHSWLGLFVGVLMYWVCLSGTLAVFVQELSRWEQPTVHESLSYEPVELQKAYQQMLAEQDELKGLTTLRLPSEDFPRPFLNANEKSWYISDEGSLGPFKHHPVTDLIAELHAELHLPHTFGMLIVSLLGVMLSALIISGLLAHRRIFKDAFRWRRGGVAHQQEADLHNRLSVWGLPFHLMIALTGAYFGLAIYLAGFYAETEYQGNQAQLFDDVFGATPDVKSYHGEMDIPKALSELKQIAPDAKPLFITFERPGQDNEYLLIGAQHTDKLIYAEQYRFDAMGNYINAVGYADGYAGQEAIFSVYRLHFGHYASEWMKLIYGLLGFALTVISVSGINLWLKKRQKEDAVNDYWAAIVWGTPLAIAVSALASLVTSVSVITLFWLAIVLSAIYGAVIRNPGKLRKHLVLLTAFGLIGLVFLHVMKFGVSAEQPAAIWVNAGLVTVAVTLFVWIKSKVVTP